MLDSTISSALRLIKTHYRYFAKNESSRVYVRHIYCLENEDGIFYVGKTINPKQRLMIHKGFHGEDIKMNILFSYLSPENEYPIKIDHERYWIVKLRNEGHNLINKNKLN
jgi:hypothetical protein